MDSLPGKEKLFLNNRNKRKAEMFLKEKHVIPLVSYLTSALLLNEPNDPVEFLIERVDEMINFRDNQGKPPILFNNDNLANVFKGIDIVNSGSIYLKQYCSAMKMLRLNETDFNGNPQVDENGRIEFRIFMHEAKMALTEQMTVTIVNMMEFIMTRHYKGGPYILKTRLKM